MVHVLLLRFSLVCPHIHQEILKLILQKLPSTNVKPPALLTRPRADRRPPTWTCLPHKRGPKGGGGTVTSPVSLDDEAGQCLSRPPGGAASRLHRQGVSGEVVHPGEEDGDVREDQLVMEKNLPKDLSADSTNKKDSS